ncbi:MAG: 6-phosphogluconolactonase, partial [Sedimentisphaerales bacterium]|nr:6-phosphogluconolactonase [Sedimentisphaerales bacterium]
MEKFVYQTSGEMAAAAAGSAADAIKNAIKTNGCANIILATGASQIEMLGYLTAIEGVDWGKVTMFHLDEYIGLGPDHPAGFGKYLRERFVEKVEGLKAAHFVNGQAEDPQQECERVGRI